MVPLQGSWPAGWDLTGTEPAPPDMRIPQFTINFALQKQAEYDQLLAELQNPDSPLFGHALTPEEIHRRFGESRPQFLAVLDWIRSRGFQIQDLTYGRGLDFIAFTGTIGQAEQAFHVRIVWYNKRAGKYANTASPQVPARFKGLIQSIEGLDNLGGPPVFKRSQLTRPEALIGPETGFAPSDFYTFYSLNQLPANINGSGNDCIALIEATNFSDSAVTDFDSTFNVIPPNPNPIPRVFADNNSDPGNLGFPLEEEALEDIEWAHAVAPGAPLKVYVGNIAVAGNIDQALFDATRRAVNDNTCGLISLSYANCNATFDFNNFHNSFIQAAGQKQTVFVSSGDFGSAGLVIPPPPGTTCITGTTANVNEIAADPNVTAVGGTQFTPNMPPPTYADIRFVPESVFNEQTAFEMGASGGGFSSMYPQPAWQKGLGVPVGTMRSVPDVAMMGSPDMPGAFIVDDESGTNVFDRVAGTSFGAPVWAGIIALINQKLSQSRETVGRNR